MPRGGESAHFAYQFTTYKPGPELDPLHAANRPLITALCITERNLWHTVTAICPARP